EGRGSGGADPPHPARSHQHLIGILRIEYVGSIESSLISAEIRGTDDLGKSAIVTDGAQLTLQNRDVRIRRKPLAGLRGIDGVESAIPTERILPRTAAGRAAGFRRPVILRPAEENVRARGVHRNGNEFRHRAQALAQAVKLIRPRAT